jgi:hypothetical protein
MNNNVRNNNVRTITVNFDPDALPHLAAALGYSARHHGSGTCFQRCAALMLDLTGVQGWKATAPTLVFGVVRAATEEEQRTIPHASTVPFIHAWVEVRWQPQPQDGQPAQATVAVLAPTLIERMDGLRPVERADYYDQNGVGRTWRLEADAFLKVAKRFKLSSAFLHQKARAGKGDVTGALLTAAGVRYRLTEHNSVIPA